MNEPWKAIACYQEICRCGPYKSPFNSQFLGILQGPTHIHCNNYAGGSLLPAPPYTPISFLFQKCPSVQKLKYIKFMM